ncbi:MAG: HI1506-related protein, partial [Pseudomonadota bacterium]
MIRITSKKDGFRRCGVAHPAAPTDHPNQAFTPEQLAALEAEPMLVVQRLADPPTTSDEAQNAGDLP